jgi:MFS superfamily sulfate permease-like transporter
MPDKPFGMFQELTLPDFGALGQPKAWKWVFMFFIIGSLESLLSAKAVDLIDPWRRKTNLNRDVVAVGVGNLAASMVGGLPMISEIVRSRANIDNGARTRFADLWHGIFLMACVAMIPMVLHLIPLAALAAMLVYTGFRLAHPSEFVHVYHVGRAQLVVFVSTIVGVLATDLLIGIGIGIAVKMVIHMLNGVPLQSMFKPYLDVTDVSDDTVRISAQHSAVFSNWIPFRRAIEDVGLVQRKNVIVDLAGTHLVDHSVMDKLHEMQRSFEDDGLSFRITGLDGHQPVTAHELAARRRVLATMRRLTVIADADLEEFLTREFVARGASGFTVLDCRGAGRRQLEQAEFASVPQVRIETIVPPEVCDSLTTFLRQEVEQEQAVTVSIESVNVLRRDDFRPLAVGELEHA